jgi:Na+-transporting NADH:ubiquinone oxidoreductase subunit NqrF
MYTKHLVAFTLVFVLALAVTGAYAQAKQVEATGTLTGTSLKVTSAKDAGGKALADLAGKTVTLEHKCAGATCSKCADLKNNNGKNVTVKGSLDGTKLTFDSIAAAK